MANYVLSGNYSLSADNTAPSYLYIAVTPSNSSADNFTQGPCRGLYIGVTGNVVAVRPDGTAITFIGVPAGWILPINAIRVNATSTTATSIVALF